MKVRIVETAENTRRALKNTAELGRITVLVAESHPNTVRQSCVHKCVHICVHILTGEGQ